MGALVEKEANWHLFSAGGAFLLYDVRAGSLLGLDAIGHEVARLYGRVPNRRIEELLGPRYGVSSVRRCVRDIEGYLARGDLCPWWTPDPPVAGLPDSSLKSLCLNIAHACNMACAYCFAGRGRYAGAHGELMSDRVARAALDLLFRESSSRHQVEVDFFGGEPLLNLGVVKESVRYARELAARYGKRVAFALTTNATLLTDEVAAFLRDNGISVVLSLDGRREVNDRLRKFLRGEGGTYDAASGAIMRFLEGQPGRDRCEPEPQPGSGTYYYVRGTFTRLNLDFSHDVAHLAAMGIRNISIEPVVAVDGTDARQELELREEDLQAVCDEYERLAYLCAELEEAGRPITFFHFRLETTRGPCLARRALGCGAGSSYLAVVPDGTIYPCHQFVGRQGFVMGDVDKGVVNRSLRELFEGLGLYRKPKCRACWARFLCGGGCHAAAVHYNGTATEPYDLVCRLTRKRFECALALAGGVYRDRTVAARGA